MPHRISYEHWLSRGRKRRTRHLLMPIDSHRGPRSADARTSAGRRRRAYPGTAGRSAASEPGSPSRLTQCLVVERRARDRQKAALHPDRQHQVVSLDHPTPHLPVHGLSFRDIEVRTVAPVGPRKSHGASLATANSPILACNDRTVSSSTSAGFRLPRSKMSAAPSSNAFFH